MSDLRTSATLLVVLLTACSAPVVAPSATVREPPVEPTVAPTAAAGDAWLVVSEQGDPRLEVILDSTLEEQTILPDGAPDATWR